MRRIPPDCRGVILIMNLSVKTIVRGVSALALCASLGLSTALAYTGDPELAFTESEPTVSAALSVAAEQPAAAPVVVAATPEDSVQQVLSGDLLGRTVVKSDALAVPDAIRRSAQSLGAFRLSVYCSGTRCCGEQATGITKSGTTVTEGRTIAVDTSVIPLGSRVYIDGYGLFIAEDTGSAIQGNKIDIAVGSHDQALTLGIDTADVYLLG